MEEPFIPQISKSRKPKDKSQKQSQTSFQKYTTEKQLLLKKQPPKTAYLVEFLAFEAKNQSQKPNQTNPCCSLNLNIKQHMWQINFPKTCKER